MISFIGPAPKQKVYHFAAKITERGDVSALCFKTPHAINLKVASWTNRHEAVTCQKCFKLLQKAAEVSL